MRFRVKVCGITRLTDAQMACKLGAEMLGFIFYKKSPRFITATGARAISSSLPSLVARVGVFVDSTYDEIMRLADFVKLDWVQLSGGENIQLVKKLKRNRLRVIKVFDPAVKNVVAKVRTSPADLVMFDNRVAGVMGGSGRLFDWDIKGISKVGNLMLAGGININNLAFGVSKLKPIVVDVNSGVESLPGIKSKLKLSRFFTECDRIRYGRK